MRHATDIRGSLVRAAMAAPFLAREEERLLAVRWREQRDEAALHRLATSHMRLVIAIAARFRQYGLSMADLIQEGHVGLLEAAARFEPEREVRFSTYATWWIRAAIQDHVLRNWSIVRGGTSSGQKALFFGLRRLRARLGRGGAGTVELHRRIAAALGMPERDVAAMDARFAAPDVSLNAPISDGDGSDRPERGSLLIDDAPLPDELAGRAIDGERRMRSLRAALCLLSERELRIIRARRLADESETLTLEALGTALGISKERVRQIESRALDKLKRALTQGGPHPTLA